MSRFRELCGQPLPIVQAPMAGVSTPALAAAVSNAGGLGSISIGASTVEQGRAMIRETRALTAAPFNVNVFCHQPPRRDPAREAAWLAYLTPLFHQAGAEPPAALQNIYPSFLENPAAFRMLLEERPAFVSFHFGIPGAGWLQGFREAGIRTLATATCLQEAQQIEAAGIDAIVAQGIEAGGHRGLFDPEAPDEAWSTAVLVRVLVERTSLPVIAAGGIMDGRGIAAALDLGAIAAQLGTAFVACPESAASAAHRAHLLGERANHTRLTRVLSGRAARGAINRLMDYGEAPGSPLPPAYPVAYDAAKQLHAAAANQGDPEYAAHWMGQGAPLARALPAAELIATLAQELAGD